MTSPIAEVPLDERVLKFLDKIAQETGKAPSLVETCGMLGLQPAQLLAALDSGALKGYWSYTPPLPDGYAKVKRHEGSYLPDLMFNFKDNGRYTGRYLVFGPEPRDLTRILSEVNWTGHLVHPEVPDDILPGCNHVKAMLGPDPKFTKTLAGYWVRAITVGEVFNQFVSSAIDIIYIAGTERDRDIWYSDQVQATLPHVYILQEDGHNENVITHAAHRGYKCTLYKDALVMVKM